MFIEHQLCPGNVLGIRGTEIIHISWSSRRSQKAQDMIWFYEPLNPLAYFNHLSNHDSKSFQGISYRINIRIKIYKKYSNAMKS